MSLVLIGSAREVYAEEHFELVMEVGGGRAAWGDFDNDGWVDLYAGGTLWHNRRGVLRPEDSALKGSGLWGDFNKDGYLDLFTFQPYGLYRNEKGRGFERVEMPALETSSEGACWGDFNGDGFRDIYMGGYESKGTYLPDFLLLNDRIGGFSVAWTQGDDAITTPGRPRPGRGIAACDWDRDGDLDVYVSNYRLEPNQLWRNDGTGKFADVAATHNALATSDGYFGGHSIGAAWGDFNNDGLMDLFAGNFAHKGQPQSRFLRNEGPTRDFAFADLGPCGIPYQESYATPVVGDFDCDGLLDLYFTSVYPSASYGRHDFPRLFHNEGNFQFKDVTEEWGLPLAGKVATYQAAVADYDQDGRLDLVTDGKLYRNTGSRHNWLEVKLEPAEPGTQVFVTANGVTRVRQVEGGTGCGNQNDAVLHFGLGDFQGRASVTVRWAGGPVQKVKPAKVNTCATVKKGR